MNEIIHTVKDYVLTSFLPGEDPKLLTPSTELLRTGILDSLGTLELVAFLEERYDIELEAHDVDASNLATLDDIARLVQWKLEART